MDPHKLRMLVFEKTGIKVDVDDPIFALVALNEAVLAETVERHIAAIEDAGKELVQLAHAAAGKPRMDAPPLRKTIPTRGPLLDANDKRSLLLALGAAVVGALIVLAGQALFAKPAALTPEQADALRRADQVNRAIERLDPKTRAAVQAELRKP